jgi:glyoxylase-like metal-dependent hydrolase (beta-lactamase superfamily II)
MVEVDEAGRWGSWRILRFSGRFSDLYALVGEEIAAVIDAGVPSDVVPVVEFEMLSRREWTREVLADWVMEGWHVPSWFDLRHAVYAGFPGLAIGLGSTVCEFVGEGKLLPGLGEWDVLELPGHTADSAGLHHRGEGLLFAGDTIITLGDRPGFNRIVAMPEDMERTKTRLRELALSAVFPGRGPALVGPETIKRALGD